MQCPLSHSPTLCQIMTPPLKIPTPRSVRWTERRPGWTVRPATLHMDSNTWTQSWTQTWTQTHGLKHGLRHMDPDMDLAVDLNMDSDTWTQSLTQSLTHTYGFNYWLAHTNSHMVSLRDSPMDSPINSLMAQFLTGWFQRVCVCVCVKAVGVLDSDVIRHRLGVCSVDVSFPC